MPSILVNNPLKTLQLTTTSYPKDISTHTHTLSLFSIVVTNHHNKYNNIILWCERNKFCYVQETILIQPSIHSASLMECISPALGLSAALTVNPSSADGGIFCILPFFFFFELRDCIPVDEELFDALPPELVETE